MHTPLDRSQLIRIGAAVIVLAIAAVIFTSGGRPADRAAAAMYFINLDTDELVAAPGSVSPIALPSGAQGVRAVVYACGSCADETKRTVAYVEKTEPVAALPADRPPMPGDPTPDDGIRVSDDRGQTWHPAQSPEGLAILNKADPKIACQHGQPYATCLP